MPYSKAGKLARAQARLDEELIEKLEEIMKQDAASGWVAFEVGKALRKYRTTYTALKEQVRLDMHLRKEWATKYLGTDEELSE